MQLTDLQIHLQPSYADNAGKYVATVQFKDTPGNAVTLVLDPELSADLLAFMGPLLTKFSEKTAREIQANILGSIEEAKANLQIENS
jgi:hypothetical protein